MTDETRTRFLAAIARQLPPERVIEVHLFAGIRQGGVESGVAVIAVDRVAAPSVEVDGGILPADDVAEAAEDPSPYRDVVTVERYLHRPRPASRYTVYSARYRSTLKGLERGKWEVSVTEEADAPLLTIDAVVRGVQRRSGDADETIRLSGDEFRAGLPVSVSA